MVMNAGSPLAGNPAVTTATRQRRNGSSIGARLLSLAIGGLISKQETWLFIRVNNGAMFYVAQRLLGE